MCIYLQEPVLILIPTSVQVMQKWKLDSPIGVEGENLHESTSHCNFDLVEYLETGEKSGITIIVNGKSSLVYSCHKMILQTMCSYFQPMLAKDANWSESQTNVVKIEVHENEEAYFLDYLKFLYGAGVSVTKENIWPFWSFSTRFLVDKLMKKCLSFFNRNLRVIRNVVIGSNATIPRHFYINEVIDIYNLFSEDCNTSNIDVKHLAAHNLLARMEEIPDDVWLSLDVTLLQDMCKGEAMVITEKKLLERVIEWLDHDSARTQLSDDVLCHVRYAYDINITDILLPEMLKEIAYFANSEKMTSLLSLAYLFVNVISQKRQTRYVYNNPPFPFATRNSETTCVASSSNFTEFSKAIYKNRKIT